MVMYAKIRRMFYREHLSINEIQRRTSLSRNTIKKWLKTPSDSTIKYQRAKKPVKLELSQFDGHFFMESSESRPVKADCNLSRFYFSHSVFSQNCLVISIPARNACELGCTMTRSR